MKQKRLLLVVGCLAAVLLAGYVTLRLTAPKQHRITKENVDAIEFGMTQKEVEVILGTPPLDDNSTEAARVIKVFSAPRHWGTSVKVWAEDEAYIGIQFVDGEVASLLHNCPRNKPFIAKLRRWLGIQ